MRVLYKNEEDLLSVMEVHKAEYDPEDSILSLCGPEADFGVQLSQAKAEEVVRQLYTEGKADVTAYPYQDIDIFDEDDDEYEEDMEDFVDNLISSMEHDEHHGTHRIPFPRR